MIVMKFGGTSVGDAERIAAVAEVVAARRDDRPAVVVSALAGVTDGLVGAVEAAGTGRLDLVEPRLADVERRNRWALSAAVGDAGRRHDVRLEVDALFETLRARCRSIRVLGEATPRAADEVLAIGELLSSRIVAAALADRGLPTRWIDPRLWMRTDGRHGEAAPDLDAVRDACADTVRAALDEGVVPVTGGFVGRAPDGSTTTLGRGGSDTSAAVLGAALDAREIQIWTDVDGLMTADPRLVPSARTLARLTFAEAAELALHGAKVLHPQSIVPAVDRGIPVRVLNTLARDRPGTVVVDEAGDTPPASAVSLASRRGRAFARVTARRRRPEHGLLAAAVAALGGVVDVALRTGVSAVVVADASACDAGAIERLGELGEVEVLRDRATLCVVGAGLASDAEARARVAAALAGHGADLVLGGASATSLLAVMPEGRLEAAVGDLHARFVDAGDVEGAPARGRRGES